VLRERTGRRGLEGKDSRMTKLLNVLIVAVGLTVVGCNSSMPREGGAPPPPIGDDAGAPEPPPSSATLRVANASSIRIWYLYVSPSSSGEWGPDQLGSQILDPGEVATIRNVPCGHSYDLKVEGSSHNTLATRYGLYLSCGETFTWTLTN
jgi:hypothetical protein